jgi:mannose-1-phosphate guanylyltransferase
VKAFLLAGGLGERLRPLTDAIPKCLVPIGGRPLLAIWLDLCARHGITDVLVNVSRHASLVAQFVGNYTGPIRISVVIEQEPCGNAGTVRDNRAFVDGEDSFFVLYSDNLTSADLSRLWQAHSAHAGVLTVGLFETPWPEMAGIATLDREGRLTAFEEKPSRPTSNLANAGIYVARASVLDLIPEGPVVDFARDVFPLCAGRMHGSHLAGYLLDIGHPAALERAAREWPLLETGE